MLNHEDYMEIALEEAQKAYDLDEVPVGVVIVYKDKILARTHNKKELNKDVTSHAEILAIQEVSKQLNSWRLNNCIMYVTLEPCPMCAGAIIQSRISKVVYGAKNIIYGSLGTILSLQNHYPDSKNLEVIENILSDKSSLLMKNFFRKK